MKTREHGILMEVYDAKHFHILRTLSGIVGNHLIAPITRRHHRNRHDYFLSEIHNKTL